MAFDQKLLPKFDENSNYETWKNDIDIWCELSDLSAKKKALAIHLSLSGRARVASSEIPVEDLKKENGVQTLIEKLDGVFLADEGRRQFAAFNELYNLRRSDGSDIDSFVTEFEHVYFKFKGKDMTLPDPVMAFMLLAACNLNDRDVQLVMSAIEKVTYDKMKSVLKRVFAKDRPSDSDCVKSSVLDIKTEPVFYGATSGRYQRGQAYSRGAFRGRGQPRGHGRQFSSYSDGTNASNRKLNPVGRDGQVSRCAICDSRYHWARFCPHAYENSKSDRDEKAAEDSETIQLSLFMGYSNGANNNSKLQTLVDESRDCAVLDTGCSSTVCGKAWLDNYVESLGDIDTSSITEENSTTTFTFADGVTVCALKRVKLPCYIGTMKATIDTEVVDCNIPMLLSKRSMKKAEMTLQFVDDSLIVSGEKIYLRCATSGHYLMPLSL